LTVFVGAKLTCLQKWIWQQIKTTHTL